MSIFVLCVVTADVTFVKVANAGDDRVPILMFFILSRVLVLLVGTICFYFFYYIPLDNHLALITPNEYLDSRMYVFVAQKISAGIALENTEFGYYFGSEISPQWAVIVYLYAFVFKIFGNQPLYLPVINLILYSYLFFFYFYVMRLANVNNNQALKFSLTLLFLPGPMYWTISLSKEIVFYIFFATLTTLFLSGVFKKKYNLCILTCIGLSFVFSILSRFNMCTVILMWVFFIVFPRLRFNELRPLYSIFFVSIITTVVFSLGVFFIKEINGFDYLNSGKYIPFVTDMNALGGSKLEYVAHTPLEVLYKTPIKLFFVITSESNILNLLSYDYSTLVSYATFFNTIEGGIRNIVMMLLISALLIKRHTVSYVFSCKIFMMAYMIALNFSLVSGFYQARYLMFMDILLVLSIIVIFYGREYVNEKK
ncbi:hypothetical protein ACTG23_14660 [Aeromonas enteropelogenes]|uniref:hypothetical protein n=1 Tax=Aeromonas enteropelogenes TaxID=29489 RepID=UPI003F7ADFD5